MKTKTFEELVCDNLIFNYNKLDKVEPHIKTRCIDSINFDMGVGVKTKANTVSDFLNKYFTETEISDNVDIYKINLFNRKESDGRYKEYVKISYGVK